MLTVVRQMAPWRQLAEVNINTDNLVYTANHIVGDFINAGWQAIPDAFKTQLPDIVVMVTEVYIADTDHDEGLWDGSANGCMTTKLAYEFYREKGVKIQQLEGIWRSFIPPKILLFAWKAYMNMLPTATNLQSVAHQQVEEEDRFG